MNSETLQTEPGEFVSALADGQLNQNEVVTALEVFRHDDAAVHRWSCYHVIREVLSTPDQKRLPVTRGADLGFVGRFSQRLALEATSAADVSDTPTAAGSPDVPAMGAIPARERPQIAANDSNFRWKFVAGLASVAALSVMAWSSLGLLQAGPSNQVVQLQPQQRVVDSPVGPMVRDVRLEEMLAAHRQAGGMSALQVPSGFLRNATFETTQDAGR